MYIHDKVSFAAIIKLSCEIAVFLLSVKWYLDTNELEGAILIATSVALFASDYFFTKKEYVTLENLREENKKLKEEIDKTKNQILNEVTGGDSYPEVMISTLAGDSKNISHFFMLHNSGDYPLHGVSVTVRNQKDVIEKFAGKDGMLSLQDLKLYQTYYIGDIGPHRSNSFGIYFKIEEDKIQYFGFSITTKNKQFSQLLKFLKKDGKHYTAIRLNTVVPSGKGKYEVLIDKADKGFPGENKGKIEWKDK